MGLEEFLLAIPRFQSFPSAVVGVAGIVLEERKTSVGSWGADRFPHFPAFFS